MYSFFKNIYLTPGIAMNADQQGPKLRELTFECTLYAYRKDAYVLNFMCFVHVLIDDSKPLKILHSRRCNNPRDCKHLKH